MKMKSVVMLAMSGLLAASFAYIAPALADYDNMNMNTSTEGQSMQNSGDGSMSNPGNNFSQNNPSSTDTTMNGNMNTNPTGDEAGSPDTATGDDDY